MSYHTATILDEDGIMRIIGGNENRSGTIYDLDLIEMKWSSSNPVCFIRQAHSANLIGESIYLFGGKSGGFKNDIHKYDIKE